MYLNVPRNGTMSCPWLIFLRHHSTMFRWVQSNIDRNVLSEGFLRNTITTALSWLGYMITAEDGAHTSLHCILNDAAEMKNGAFYSQFGPYVDKVASKGGWPLKEFPNKNATPENAAKLWEISEKLIIA
jgi:hypothetical protein